MNKLLSELFFFAPWKLQLGILGISLGGSKKDEEAKTEGRTKVKKQQKSKGLQKSKGTAKTNQKERSKQRDQSTTQQDQTLSLLDDETQELLTNLLQGVAGGDQLGEINQVLADRALSADEDLAGMNEAIVTNARGQLEERLGQTMQQLARTAGSSQNSLVAQLGLDEAAAVERELADLSSTLGLQTRRVATEELQGAQASGQSLAIQLAEVLKGATQVGSSTSETDAISKLISVLSGKEQTTQQVKSDDRTTELIRALEEQTTKGKAKQGGFGIKIGL